MNMQFGGQRHNGKAPPQMYRDCYKSLSQLHPFVASALCERRRNLYFCCCSEEGRLKVSSKSQSFSIRQSYTDNKFLAHRWVECASTNGML